MTILRIKLLSDGCFAGSALDLMTDADICQEFDELGLPVIGARSIRGLLVEQAGILLSALKNEKQEKYWIDVADALYSRPGSNRPGNLKITDARFAEDIRTFVRNAVERKALSQRFVASSITVVRRQTRIDPETGSAKEHSLRSARMIKLGEILESKMSIDPDGVNPSLADQNALLAFCVSMVRNGGVNRSRGWGKIRMRLFDQDKDVTSEWLEPLRDLLSSMES